MPGGFIKNSAISFCQRAFTSRAAIPVQRLLEVFGFYIANQHAVGPQEQRIVPPTRFAQTPAAFLAKPFYGVLYIRAVFLASPAKRNRRVAWPIAGMPRASRRPLE